MQMYAVKDLSTNLYFNRSIYGPARGKTPFLYARRGDAVKRAANYKNSAVVTFRLVEVEEAIQQPAQFEGSQNESGPDNP